MKLNVKITYLLIIQIFKSTFTVVYEIPFDQTENIQIHNQKNL